MYTSTTCSIILQLTDGQRSSSGAFKYLLFIFLFASFFALYQVSMPTFSGLFENATRAVVVNSIRILHPGLPAFGWAKRAP